MSNKFKMPNKFKKVSTVSSIRQELIATGDQLCISVAKNMRDASIKEIEFNLVQTKDFDPFIFPVGFGLSRSKSAEKCNQI